MERRLGGDPEFLAALMKQLPAGVVLAEIPSGRIVLANDELERILGHRLLESPSVSEYGAWGAIHDDGRPYSAEEHPLARVVTHNEVIEDEEVRYRRPDGEVRTLSVNAAPLVDGSGRPTAAVATFVDISARKRAENAQALLAAAGKLLASSLDVRRTLESTVDLAVGALTDLAMIYLRDVDGGFRLALAHADPKVVEKLGGHTVGRPLPPDHPALEVIRTGKTAVMQPVSQEVIRAMALDAAHEEVFAELGVEAVLLVPMVGREQVQGAFGFVTTRRSRRIDSLLRATGEELGRVAGLAAENAQLFERAEAEARLREEVMAVVSHDLRNPLNMIQLAMQALDEAPEPCVDARRVARTRDLTQGAVTRMKRLIGDLLDVERIAVQRFSIERRPESLSDVVEESVFGYHALAEQASISLRVQPARDFRPVVLSCDRGRMLQVLGNLLDNAIKFTPRDGEVEVCYGPDRTGVRITVADGGEGIPIADRERIFERFWRRDTRRPGTGLGLAIAKGIVEAHGGRIWVEGRRGPGAAFHVWLPVDD